MKYLEFERFDLSDVKCPRGHLVLASNCREQYFCMGCDKYYSGVDLADREGK